MKPFKTLVLGVRQTTKEKKLFAILQFLTYVRILSILIPMEKGGVAKGSGMTSTLNKLKRKLKRPGRRSRKP